MEIVLTYEGKIPSKTSSLKSIWDMRRSFHNQLERVWGKRPFDILKEWEDSGFAANAPDFRVVQQGITFVPIYGKKIGVGISLDITLLSGTPQRRPVLHAGDLDNRIKRVIDALHAPKQPRDLIPEIFDQTRWYCLVEDDDAVMEVKAQLGHYLKSDDPAQSFVIVRVRPFLLIVNTGNLEMLF